MTQKSCPVWDAEVSNPSLNFFLSFSFPCYDSKPASTEFLLWNYSLSWLQTPKGYHSSGLVRCIFGVSCSGIWGMPSKGLASQVYFALLGKNNFHYVFNFILGLNFSVKHIKVQSRAAGFLCFLFPSQIIILETNDKHLGKKKKQTNHKSNTSSVSIGEDGWQ